MKQPYHRIKSIFLCRQHKTSCKAEHILGLQNILPHNQTQEAAANLLLTWHLENIDLYLFTLHTGQSAGHGPVSPRPFLVLKGHQLAMLHCCSPSVGLGSFPQRQVSSNCFQRWLCTFGLPQTEFIVLSTKHSDSCFWGVPEKHWFMFAFSQERTQNWIKKTNRTQDLFRQC